MSTRWPDQRWDFPPVTDEELEAMKKKYAQPSDQYQRYIEGEWKAVKKPRKVKKGIK